jgi:hypothetical protein
MRNTPYTSKLYRWLLQLTREVFQDFTRCGFGLAARGMQDW